MIIRNKLYASDSFYEATHLLDLSLSLLWRNHQSSTLLTHCAVKLPIGSFTTQKVSYVDKTVTISRHHVTRVCTNRCGGYFMRICNAILLAAEMSRLLPRLSGEGSVVSTGQQRDAIGYHGDFINHMLGDDGNRKILTRATSVLMQWWQGRYNADILKYHLVDENGNISWYTEI